MLANAFSVVKRDRVFSSVTEENNSAKSSQNQRERLAQVIVSAAFDESTGSLLSPTTRTSSQMNSRRSCEQISTADTKGDVDGTYFRLHSIWCGYPRIRRGNLCRLVVVLSAFGAGLTDSNHIELDSHRPVLDIQQIGCFTATKFIERSPVSICHETWLIDDDVIVAKFTFVKIIFIITH